MRRHLAHANRAGVQFRHAVVRLVAPLPNPVVGRAVRGRYVEDEVLHEGHLVQVVHDLQACREKSVRVTTGSIKRGLHDTSRYTFFVA